jgi:predicted branched-subunit amino acid permease
MTVRNEERNAFRTGVRDVAPLVGALAPVGFVIGTTAAATSVPPLVGLATAPLIFGASAQMVALRLLDAGAAPVLVIASVALLSLRLALYGAVMAPHWRHASRRWKLLASALLAEPTVAVGSAHAETVPDEAIHRRYYLGAGLTLWFGWLAATAAGLTIGARAHALVLVDPLRVLACVALAIPAALATPGARRAAVAAAVTAILGGSLPDGTVILVAAAAGVLAGLMYERRAS